MAAATVSRPRYPLELLEESINQSSTGMVKLKLTEPPEVAASPVIRASPGSVAGA
jgi:hypothetical protein